MPDLDPQVIIIFIVMIVGAVRWVLEKVTKPSEREPSETEDTTLEDFFEQQRLAILARQRRKLAETDGTTEPVRGSQGPPPVPGAAPSAVPASRATPPPAPGLMRPERAQTQERKQRVEKQVRRPVLSKAEQEALARVQKGREIGGVRRRTSRRAGSHSVVDLLNNPQSARDAILLTEVLGKPKGAL